MLSAARRSWPWIYSSMSCKPVTSGAPSHTTRSACSPWKCEMICVAVDAWNKGIMNVTVIVKKNNQFFLLSYLKISMPFRKRDYGMSCRAP